MRFEWTANEEQDALDLLDDFAAMEAENARLRDGLLQLSENPFINPEANAEFCQRLLDGGKC